MWSKYLKNTVVLLAVTAVIFGVFVSCENPFVKNLGGKVDVEWPTVTVYSPPVGSIINKQVTFTGNATAYRKIARIEVRILHPINTSSYLIPWTKVSSATGSDTSQNWTYHLDTEGPIFTNAGLGDDNLYLQFRVWDENNLVIKDENVNTYAYVIKNQPSKITMTLPADKNLNDLSAEVETGSEIRGTVMDTRGIKPGFPRIKIWKATDTEPADTAPPDQGWVTLFLSSNGKDLIDTMVNATGAQDWHYGDRSQMPALNSNNFSYKLAKIDHINITADADGNEIREAVYKTPFESIDVGEYRFRIWTSDTFFYTDDDIKNGLNGAHASMKQWPRAPQAGEIVLQGFNPPIPGYTPGVNDPSLGTGYTPGGPNDPLSYTGSRNADYWTVTVKSRGQDPQFKLDYTDAERDTPEPNIYITKSESYKTLSDSPGSANLFRLRVEITHPDGVSGPKVSGSQAANPILTWTPGGAAGVAMTRVVGSSTSDSSIFEYMGTEANFSSASQYRLIVTAAPTGTPDREKSEYYTVNVSKSKPSVEIASIKGADTEPTVSAPYYTVNGNIEVTVIPNDNERVDIVKWAVELASTPSASAIDTKINAYNAAPSAAGLTFFDAITSTASDSSTATEGTVKSNNTFKFNTKTFNDGTAVYLYVIARNSFQKLGFVKRELRIDQSSDDPKMPGGEQSLYSTTYTDAKRPTPIASVSGVFVTVGNDQKLSGTIDNVINKDTGIDLAFKDDDGIDRTQISITITAKTATGATIGATSQPFTPQLTAQGQVITANVNREWSARLTQQAMAAALYGGNSESLKDGLYELVVTYKDAEKVTIVSGDAPPVTKTSTFYFCVSSDQPEITITAPGENSLVTDAPPLPTITGTIKSRVPVQKLWISFTPALSGEPTAISSSMVPLWRDGSYSTASVWNADPPDADGVYTYYWQKTNVNFVNVVTVTASEERSFTMKAYDNVGNPGERKWSVRVDHTPPTVRRDLFYFGRPLEAGRSTHRVNGKFNFIISADDTSGIKKTGNLAHVWWWIKRKIDSAPAQPVNKNDIIETVTTNGASGQFTLDAGQGQSGDRYMAMVNGGTADSPWSQLPAGTYVLYAMAQDNADNYSAVAAFDEFEIDPDADYPVMDNGVSPNGTNDFRLKNDLSIKGRVTDDDGFTGYVTAGATTATVRIRFRTNDSNTAWESTWRPISGGATGSKVELDPAGYALTFEYVIPDSLKTGSGYFANDGTKEYQILVTDIQNNKNPTFVKDGKINVDLVNMTASGTPPTITPNISAVSKTFPSGSGGYSFILKNSKPEIFFKQFDEVSNHPRSGLPGDTAGAKRPVLQTRSDLLNSLSGSHTAGGGVIISESKVVDKYLKSVKVEFISEAAQSWGSQNLYVYDVNASSDTFGPGQGNYTSGVTEKFVWDLSASSLLALNWLPSADDFYNASTFTSAIADGKYTIVITAEDRAGNIQEGRWSFNKDTTGPLIDVSNMPKKVISVPSTPPLASAVDIISGDNSITINGRFSDDYSNIKSATFSFDGASSAGLSGSVNIPDVNNPAAQTKNWTIPIPPPGTLNDGLHRVSMTAYDVLNNPTTIENLYLVVDRNDPFVDSTDDIKVGGIAGYSPPAAIKNEDERVFGAKGTKIASGNNDVIFTLSGMARDENLRVMTFAIRPVSSSTTPVAKSNATTPLGTLLPAWSAPGATPVVYQSNDDDGNHRLKIQATSAPNTWEWTLDILGRDLYSLQQPGTGWDINVPCFVTIEAKDLADRKSDSRHWRFKLDTEQPKVFPQNFDDAATASGASAFMETGEVTLMMRAEDDNRVRSVKYYISKYNYLTGSYEHWDNQSLSSGGTPTWSTIMFSPGSLVTWNLKGADLPPAIYGEFSSGKSIFTENDGQFKISIQAIDDSLGSEKAGDMTPRDIVFFIDRKDPAVKWDGANAEQVFFRNKSDGTIDLQFTALDVNSVPDITASIKGSSVNRPLSGGEITIPAILNGDAVNGYSKPVSLKPNLNSGGDWANGTYVLTLTVKDTAGNTTTDTRTIIVDNAAPAIKINEVAGNGTTTAIPNAKAITGRQEFRGSFTKAAGMSPVSFVAFYIAPWTDAATPALIAPAGSYNESWLRTKDNDLDVKDPDVLTALYNAGWRFYEGDGSRAALKDTLGNKPVLAKMQDNGLTNINMLIPNVSALTYSGPHYAGGDVTGTGTSGVSYDNNPIPSSDAINKLTVYFLAVDEAGNRNVSLYDYWVYPEGDRPTATLTSPNQDEHVDKRLINGRFRISGAAKDNFQVKTVWFRIMGKETSLGSGVYEMDKPIIDIQINEWDTAGNEISGSPQSPVRLERGTQNYGDGWFKASGGGGQNIPWYAYINDDGKLDPLTEGSRPIQIQVLAEDYQYDDTGVVPDPPLDGMLSKHLGNPPAVPVITAINARVVKGTPVFSDERIRRVGSNTSDTPIVYPWYTTQEVNIRKRAAYRVTVSHEAGLRDIVWTPPAESSLGTNPINLLDGLYSGYSAAVAGMDATVPTGDGIAVKAEPQRAFTGNGMNLTAGKYLIYKWHDALKTAFLTELGNANSTFVNTTLTVTAGTYNLGAAVLMQANATTGKFEWDVVIDVHADLINKGSYNYPYDKDHPAPVPDLNKDNYSGRFRVNLSATETSRTTPLTADYRVELPIDNQPPQAVYTFNTRVNGTAATIGGSAGDYAPETGVGGLDRVILWFSRKPAGTPSGTPEQSIPWTGSGFQSGATPEGITLDPGVTMPQEFAESDATGTNRSSIVMKYSDPLKMVARFGHKLPIGFTTTGGDLGTSWYVELDSTQIESGRVTAHFIVYDKAGNASYYTQKLIIMNNVPMIKEITLATDIRGDLDFRNDFDTNKNYAESYNSALKMNPHYMSVSPFSIIKGKTYPNSTSADITKGVSEPVTINTLNQRAYGPLWDQPFNVRNGLLAVKVDVAQELDSKGRTFRVEYVSRATLLQDSSGDVTTASNNGNGFYKGIRAGRVYIINDAGKFPWGSLGAPVKKDEIPPKGMAFMAVEDGDSLSIPVLDYRDDNTKPPPSAWELNTGYYNGTTLDRPNVPTPLQLSDIVYEDATISGTVAAAQSAEFVYNPYAFDSQQFNSSGSNSDYIHDFKPTIDTRTDATNNNFNRPMPYPAFKPVLATANASVPWEAHSLFIIRVFGGTEDELFGDFALLSIRVNNDDRTKPYAQVYDLNPLTEGQDKDKDGALGITSIGGNRTRGGLYYTAPNPEPAKSGHIEPRGGTSLTSVEMGGADNVDEASISMPFADKSGFFAADTVSGEVILRGYVEDDQRIAGVRLAIAIGTGAPTNVDILEPGQAGANKLLKATTAGNGRVGWYDTVDVNRHRVEWAYLWNTEQYPANLIVGDDIRVTAIAYNAGAANALKTTMPSDTIVRDNPTPPATRDSYNIYNPGFNPRGVATMPRYNVMPVNLRPYITGFLRNKAQFSHNTRSRQGRYMFYRGETAVVKGFNLGGGGTSAPYINLPGMGDFSTVTVGSPGDYNISTTMAVADRDRRYRQFTVGAGATSLAATGLVTYRVTNTSNSTTARYAVNTGTGNNTTAGHERLITAATTTTPIRPTYIQPWNVETVLGVDDGSALWDDFVQVHIWQSNSTITGDDRGRFARGQELFDPAMSIDPATGTLWASHNEGGGGGGNTGTTKVSSNDGKEWETNDNAFIVAQFIDPITNSDIFISTRPSGYNNNNHQLSVWTAYSIIGKPGGNNNDGWGAFGGIWLNGPQGSDADLNENGGPIAITTNNGFTTAARYASRSQYHGESTWYNASISANNRADPPSTAQFKNPHIVTHFSTNEHIHVAYYDSLTGAIKYRYNRRNNTSGQTDADTINTNAAPRAWTNLDGGVDEEDQTALTAGGNGAFTAIAQNGRIKNWVTSLAATRTARGNIDAGEHNAIALNSSGHPVIVYYDKTNSKLKMAVSNNTAPIAASAWQIISEVIPSSNAFNHKYTGEYVSMAIDTTKTPNNVVHIAALNSMKKNLVYIKGTLNGQTYTTTEVKVVDSVGSVGRWCKISLDADGNPWISYQDESYATGSRDGVKLAYYDTAAFYKGSGTKYADEDVDMYGNDVRGWEAMHVPTQFSVENARLGMECYPTIRLGYTNTNAQVTTGRFWKGAVGYFGQDYYRIAYYVK